MTAIGNLIKLAKRRGEEQRRSQHLAACPPALDGADDLRVQAEAGIEGEVPAVGGAEPDAAFPPAGQILDQPPGRIDGIGRQLQGAGEHVRVAARQGSQRWQVRGVAAGLGIIRAAGGSGRGEPGGFSPVTCLHDLKVDRRGEGPDDDIAPLPGCGGGVWVHDQKRAHGPRLARRLASAHLPPRGQAEQERTRR